VAIHSQINPIAFTIGPLSVHWYGIAFAGTFVFGEWLVRRMLTSERRTDIDTSRLVVYAMVGAVLGARIVHCAFYDPQYYLTHPLKIFAVWEGGLASHGGVIGLILGLIVATRKLATGTLLYLLDRITIPSAVGGAVVRLANFINSEILGKPTESSFGVIFDSVDQIPRHPVQLYEAMCYLTLGLILYLAYARTTVRTKPGKLLGIFLIGIFIPRLLLEFFKVPQAAYEDFMSVSVGQVLSIPFIAFGLFLIARPVSGQQNDQTKLYYR